MQWSRRSSCSYSCSRWGSSLVRSVWVFCASVLLWISWPASATGVPNSGELLTATIESLERAAAILQTLETDLETQSLLTRDLEESLRLAGQRLLESEASLLRLEARLKDSEDLRATLGLDLAATRSEYAKLRDSFIRLSTTFADYKQEAENQIAGLERSRGVWRIVGLGAIAVSVIVGIIAVVK